MSAVYCDTSILMPVFVDGAQSARVEAWIGAPRVDPIVSDLVILDFSAALSRLVSERVLDDAQARTVNGVFDAWCDRRLRPLTTTSEILASARTIVQDAALGVRGPDALHLALLQVTGLPFATFDARLRRAADTLGLATLEPPPL
ncbi:type II toxin-antitoxin system VapC family toxin [Methylobacterium platani]|uniref:PIN domain-containing protein n=2 Tax=Methylobacterium platani TaxID=427683 RepID=A0A179S350_9HYPH|nr:type II toxin-antitoxin system VapC family toxin [Methylobacterium platani]KMO18724.1 hypothetical protein SQ03_09780 [Methylobacterium platani JCM 14648]OAS20108.1 hypothetical protein A5481_23700 [Methylobacterium platani]